MSKRLIARIETGGTKLLARVSEIESGAVIGDERWTTTSPDAAADSILGFLQSASAGEGLVAIGIAAFGPLIIDPASSDYGRVLETSKPGWTGSNLRSAIEQHFHMPVAVDSDVNAAAIAEQAIGAGKNLQSVAYVTVGTGIGAGLALGGRSLKGALHPEAGHLPIIRRPGDKMPSVCPFHASCAEGLVSGPALRKRLGDGRDLAEDLELLDLVADYLGQLAAILVLAWAPHRIVWGGGAVASTPRIISEIEKSMRDALGGYGVGDAANQPGFCVAASLRNAGLEGAMIMARDLAESVTKKAL
jgi:fructokinase